MRILNIDIGTGTQDILLFDSSKLIENCVQMIMPSPTAIVATKIHQATIHRHPILLTGVNMGGGPNKWALTQHIKAGLAAYATEEAALTFDDDLEIVKDLGVIIITPDEAPRKTDLESIELKDVDLDAIRRCLNAFNVGDKIDAISIAVLDHGFVLHMSNRVSRFEHLRKVLATKRELAAFCYLAEEVPDYLTRMKSVIKSVGSDIPLLLLETGVSSILGALQDEEVAQHDDLLIVNIGNGHTIAFHLFHNVIEGLFEHHTEQVNATIMDSLIVKLAQGVITNEEIYNAGGHGALVFRGDKKEPFIAITGPQHGLMSSSLLKLHTAVPHGNIMLTGCYGLVKANALRRDNWREEIEHALARKS